MAKRHDLYTSTIAQLGLLEEVVVRLDGCGISVFPQEVFCKPKLRELFLSRNRITAIPPAISSLKALRVLRLDQNALVGVPPELGNLSGLQSLDLSGNKVCAATTLGFWMNCLAVHPS